MKFTKKTDLKKLEKIDFNRKFKEQHLLFQQLTLIKVNYFFKLFQHLRLTNKYVTDISFHGSVIRPYNTSVFHDCYFSYS